ncbi:toprim domain-containing protein [Paludifilum halophilum]|uniref:Toprim domain-containing protein n=1 Tax=Paludifilum halophilum TaxID=1642702 RepID=A0A235B8F1_9BACL|nr:toprim domain-containing protein [Paludifilum halophilum]OYD08580.1 hypothetical protein CHM34_07080 [Paludifilum halophilum]
MELNGVEDIAVNVREELESFEWEQARGWETDKLIACSPFRQDSTPSFYVWLEDSPVFRAKAGYWGDSGGSEYERGDFITLLSFLRQETREETAQYLLDKYAPGWDGDFRNIEFDFTWIQAGQAGKRPPIPLSYLDPYKFRHPYLERRGVTERVQRAMQVGYDRDKKAVTIPWFNGRGELVQVKRRSVTSKFFRFLSMEEGGHPVRELLYGIDVIHRKELDCAVITEAEIDALYAMSSGFPAIAVGGAKFSKEKAALIKRSPLRKLVIAADNDMTGQALEEQIIKRLSGQVGLWRVRLPKGYKDLNDVKEPEALSCLLQKPERVSWRLVRI